MKIKLTYKFRISLLIYVILIFIVSCSTTKNLKENEFLLAKNTIFIKYETDTRNKGEIKDNLNRLETQKPNSFSWLLQSPRKLLYYNLRYKKFHNLPDSLLPKSAERPVIFDSALISKSNQNIKNYLFNLGYFYVKIKDTFYEKHQKAYVRQYVNLGKNYKINTLNFECTDTAIARILESSKNQSVIQKAKEYSISLIDEERSRIVTAIRNKGYYHFTQENIATFRLDTFDKSFFKNAESPFEGVINFINNVKDNRSPTVDVDIEIKLANDTTAFKKYIVGSVNVYPDFRNNSDLTDTTLFLRTIDSVRFLFHDRYVNAKILAEHIFIEPGKLYTQESYDKTFVKLNELGIFQYIRIAYTENPYIKNTLDCNIYMNKTKKYDFSQNDELSNGSTYSLGVSAGINYHNKNFEKGANLFTLSLSGGLEFSYNENYGKNIINHLQLLTEYLGLNASVDFPKFLSPVGRYAFDNYNLPHTIISGGSNLIDRLDYFRLINTSFNYTYSWHKSKNVTWTFAPAFFNVIQMPSETDSFKKHLDQFPFLKNSYKPTFIEGESISFTFNNAEKKHNKNYTYLRLGLEESGTALNILNLLGVALNDLYKIKYSEYSKFDFDLRQYVMLHNSTFAFRFWGGVGVPYGESNTLPYIKQYFVGGPYSMRGWQIRSLGPGSFNDSVNTKNNTLIDLTGDVKLELNTEYRFPITPLFAGAIKMNGALFADAGNIWLAKRDSTFPGGEFELNTLGNSIAVDLGAGARFDIASFLTFRVDLAMPVKKPYLSTNNGWVFDQIAFTNSSWRANNLVLQIAIGYPF